MARLFIITKHATMNRAVIFKQQRLKTGGQYSKVLRIPLNQALMPYTCLNVDWALLNFRLFLKLGPPSRFAAQGKLPPLPPPLSVVLTMNASNLTSCFYFRQISTIHAKCYLEIKETNARN